MGRLNYSVFVGFLAAAMTATPAIAAPAVTASGGIWLPYFVMTAALSLALLFGLTTYSLNRNLHDTVQRLRANNERLRQVSESSQTVYWENDADGLYTFVGGAVERVFGYSAEELVGKKYYHDLFPAEDRDALKRAIEDSIGCRDTFQDFENRIQRKDGRVITVSTSCFPLFGADGEFLGYQGADTDITERVEAETALRESETKFRYAIAAANDGIWDWNFVTGEMVFTPRVYEMLGYELGEITMTSDTWASYMHPDDVPAAHRAVEQELANPDEMVSFECRMKTKDGSYIWMQSRGKLVEQTPDGAPLRLVGTLTDITERKQAQAALEASEARFRNFFELGLIGMAITAPSKKAPLVNDRLCEITGYTQAELEERTWVDLTHPDDVEADLEQFQAVLDGEQDGYTLEKRLVRADGEVIHVAVAVRCVRGATGEVDHFISLVDDITERKHAQAALRESEAQLRYAMEAAQDGIWDWNLVTGAFELSPRMYEMLVRDPADFTMTSESWIEFVHPDDRETALAALQEGLSSESGTGQAEYRVVTPDGRLLWVLSRGKLVERTEDGAPQRIVGTLTDITDRKQALAALEASDALFESITANVPGIIYQFQAWPDGRTIVPYVSEGVRELYGVSPEELRENAWILVDRVVDADRERVIHAIRASFASLEVWMDEFRVIRADGAMRWLQARSRPRKQEDGSVLWHGYITDITKQKEAEEEARRSEQRAQRQRAALATLAIHPEIVSGNLDAAKRLLAEVAARAMEVERVSLWLLSEEDTELSCFELYEASTGRHSEGALLCSEDYLPYFEGIRNFGRIVAHEAQTDPLTACFTESYLQPLGITSMLDAGFHLNGCLAGVVCIEHIGTPRRWNPDEETFATTLAALCAQVLANVERKKAEHALMDSEERFRTFVESAPSIAIQGYAADGTVRLWNEASERLYGYSAEEAIGGNLLDLIIPGHMREAVWEGLCEALESGGQLESAELELKRKDGSLVQVHSSHAIIRRDGHEPELFCIDVDISERKRAEAALEERDALFAKLSSNVPGFLFQYQMWPDGRSRFPFASEGMRSTYEIDPEEVKEDGRIVWERGHPDDRETVRQAILKSMRTGKMWSQSFRLVLPERGVRWMRGHALPEAQEDGSTLWHGYISDISEQVEAFEERRQLEQQFERTQRLESLGVMAGGIAHDFNNILMAVLANTEVVQRELPADSPAVRPLSEIHAATNRAAELCRQMLAYSGKTSMVSEHIRIGALVQELTQLLRASIPKKVHLVIDESPDAPPVHGDASQLGQVVMNLIINGAEAIGERGGTVRVGINAAELHEGESMRWGFDEVLPPGKYCMIEVLDDGAGMDAATRARIFEPFYTTKFTGRGLGLAATLGIVRSHQGALAVKSKPGHGSQFRVLLPAAKEPAPLADDAPLTPEELPFHWDGGVLLVDDEAPLRLVGQRMLQRMGCRVWTAEDGLKGLEQYDAHADGIDLVVLDLTMPNMDGHETLIELRKRDPGLPIIIASGFTEADLNTRFEGEAITGTLQKPFGYHKLEAAIRAFVARRQTV